MSARDRRVRNWTRPAEAGTWDDYEEIRQILSGYCYAVDHAINEGTVPDLGSLYHPDVEFTTSFDESTSRGLEAVTAWYQKFLGSRSGYYRWVRHKISESFIEVSGDSAKSSAYWDADSVDRNSTVRVMAGRYDDTFVRVDGRWLISERHCAIYYHYAAGTAGEFRGR